MNNTETLDGANVLIVDDAPANLDLLRNILEPSGCHIFFATSGEQALEVAAESIPDVILMDVMMPGIDGFETCRRLKQGQVLQDTPVVFVTAKTDVEDLVKGFEAGGVDYITKPVKPLEVKARVSTHLKLRKLIREQKRHLSELRRAKKELQELSATKDRFLSNLGRNIHESLSEIRQASVSLRGAADEGAWMQDGVEPRLESLNRYTKDLLRLLENIMEWPRVQAGQKLDLFNTELSDRDLGHLVKSLDDLRFLSLAETKVTDAGLAHLSTLSALEELHLDNTEITDEGLERLTPLAKLRVLDLKNTAITDDGLARLKSLTHLRGLYLARTRITDEGLAHLSALENLETLILWDTQVTDKGVRHLRSLGKLREVMLWGTHVTEPGADALRKALPQCDVSTNMLA